MKLSDFPQHVQRKIVADNPHLFGMGRLAASQPKSSHTRTLEQKASAYQSQHTGLGTRCQRRPQQLVRLTLCRFGKREFDGDALVASMKPLRDTIAQWFFGGTRGQHDGDKFVDWQYGQVVTKGECGVTVKAELI